MKIKTEDRTITLQIKNPYTFCQANLVYLIFENKKYVEQRFT